MTGRDVLSAGEMRRMLYSEKVVATYHSRKASKEWGKWAAEHPEWDTFLKAVEMELNG